MLYCINSIVLSYSPKRPQMENSLCWLLMNFTGSCRENSEACNIFSLCWKDQWWVQRLLDPICCSEMHPLQKLDLFSVAAHYRSRCGGNWRPFLSKLHVCRDAQVCLGLWDIIFQRKLWVKPSLFGKNCSGQPNVWRERSLLTVLRIWNVRCSKFITRLLLAAAFCKVKRWSRWLDLWRNRIVMHSLP